MVLKMHGSLSASDIGEMLGITGEAARQHLLRLAGDGLAISRSAPAGVGRPTQLWSLTPAAQARFPDTHVALTVQILEIVRQSLGEAALDAVISAREAGTRSAYEAATENLDDIKDRLAKLVALRSAEGYMAAWSEEADGTFLLVENHCPICAAATACQGFCRAEIDVFRAVLGPDAKVERTDHIVNGGRRCSYTITPQVPA